MELDEEYMVPVNYQTYYLDIEKANIQSKTVANWTLMSDLVKDFGLQDLSPDSLYSIALRIRDNETVAMEYIDLKGKRCPKRTPVSCDKQCRR